MESFKKEDLLEFLKSKYAYLNDNDAKALEVYNQITSGVK